MNNNPRPGTGPIHSEPLMLSNGVARVIRLLPSLLFTALADQADRWPLPMCAHVSPPEIKNGYRILVPSTIVVHADIPS
jgi:hypothetical protein